MVTPLQGDIVWKMEKLNPMSPKKDGSAEAYLREIGMAPEEFMCDTLMITGEGCAICNDGYYKVEKDFALEKGLEIDEIAGIDKQMKF